jgi:integrase
MDFDKMLELFSAENEYIAEMKNFKSYLLDDNSNISIKLLGGIRTEHIIESIDYNIKHNGYESKSIAFKYAVAIAQFYRYANQSRWFSNDDLLKKINTYRLDSDSYYARINTYIKTNSKLKKKSSKTVYSEQEVIDLLTVIDEYFENIDNEKEKKSYFKMSGMLAIKLMLLTGAKYSAIRNIIYNDLDSVLNTITINGFKIRLPINLSRQFQIYKEVRQFALDEASEYLFTDNNGSQWNPTTSYTYITELISECLMRFDTTGITKYGIKNLLLVGTGVKEIERLTGAGKDLIRDCMTEKIVDEKDNIDIYINRKISNTDIFYKL